METDYVRFSVDARIKARENPGKCIKARTGLYFLIHNNKLWQINKLGNVWYAEYKTTGRTMYSARTKQELIRLITTPQRRTGYFGFNRFE